MPIFTELPPLSLYIHLPWCRQKCPYCDFNSHELKERLPEELYVAALLQQLDSQRHYIQQRPLISIFFGGGTPSLFSARMIEHLLSGLDKRLPFTKDIEITMEANPGTIDQVHFADFRLAGVNRFSLGIQSLQNDKLKQLGRIHDQQQAQKAIQIAKSAGFNSINLDLMYGLPHQSLHDALSDLENALHFQPDHISWYQLTIEPNTFFHHQPPPLPDEDLIWEMQEAGQMRLKQAGFQQYEISAYARAHRECRHNRNYWEFGDYLGIGAGAHSKITDRDQQQILRFAQVKHPKDYLDRPQREKYRTTVVMAEDLPFEFMLNALRLIDGVPVTFFPLRTGLDLQMIANTWQQGIAQGLLHEKSHYLRATAQGMRYHNNLLQLFLPKLIAADKT